MAGLGKTLAAGDSPKQITRTTGGTVHRRMGRELGRSMAPVRAFHGADGHIPWRSSGGLARRPKIGEFSWVARPRGCGVQVLREPMQLARATFCPENKQNDR